ncbi:hypothetical protein [Nostoc sp.]
MNSSGTTNPFWIAKTVVWVRSQLLVLYKIVWAETRTVSGTLMKNYIW